MTTIQFDTDADGIATLTIDVPGQSMNVIGPDFIADLSAAIDRIKSEDAIKGAVICSGKASGFMGGMDLKNMQSMLPEGSEGNMTALFEKTFVLNDLFRRLETCGKPIACWRSRASSRKASCAIASYATRRTASNLWGKNGTGQMGFDDH